MTEPASTTTSAAPDAPPAKKLYTLADLKAHATEASCWVLIRGKVYDVTPFLDEHPGGFDIILSSTGESVEGARGGVARGAGRFRFFVRAIFFRRRSPRLARAAGPHARRGSLPPP